MEVPYAKKWQKETAKLRKAALECDLTEELKWGKPCFTYEQKNVARVEKCVPMILAGRGFNELPK